MPYDDVSCEVEEIASTLGDSTDFYSQDDIAQSLHELISAGGGYDSPHPNITVDSDESKTADDLLKNALDAYNQKYGLNLTAQSLTENLRVASFLSRNDKNINDLVQRGILGNAADHLYFKTLVSLYKMIDKTIQNVTTSEYAEQFSLESMAIIDRLFAWLGQLDQLKERYKMFDFDKTMQKLISKEEEQDTTTVNPVPNLIKSLMKLAPAKKTDN